jgi:hypothetical protein
MPITELEYTFNAEKGRLKKGCHMRKPAGRLIVLKKNEIFLYGVEHEQKNGQLVHIGRYNKSNSLA